MANTYHQDSQNVGKRAISGGKALVARHVAGFAVNFSGTVFLARSLGPEGLGLFFISFTFYSIFRQLIDFGLNTHFISHGNEPEAVDIKAAFTLQQAVALVGLAICVLWLAPATAGWYWKDELLPLMLCAGAGAYFNSFQSVPLSTLERRMSYGKVGIIEFSETLAFNAVAALLVYRGMGLTGVAVAFILRGLVPATLALRLSGLRPVFTKDTGRVFFYLQKDFRYSGRIL